MEFLKSFKKEVFNINSTNFKERALQLFRFQNKNNKIYQEYIRNISLDPLQIVDIQDIPFLPIEFFKTNIIKSSQWREKLAFESSGTSQTVPSRHYLDDPDFYTEICEKIFNRYYGPLNNYHILALLPSYLERGNSSLVYMVQHLIKKTDSEAS